MVSKVASPRKSIHTVLERVGVYGFVGGSSQKRLKCDFQDEDDTMEMVQIGAERTKNVLILMSDTGGGHRASAEAIRDAFKLEFGDEYRVSSRSQSFVLPLEEVAKRASLDRLEESQIRVFGLPIRPSFCRAILSKGDLRVELEMEHTLPAVLLMGGGEGMGPVKKTAKALGDALFDEELGKPIGQMIVICGRNEALASTLRSLQWNIPVQIKGFQKQMEKWMGACDCIITKAGPGTIAEALIRGLPIILNDYIPGQEKGNVPFVVDNGAGVFTRRPKETARIVAEWFTTKSDELKRMSENSLKLAQPNAVFDIVKDIHELACQRGPLANIPYVLTSSFSSLI
ncbi:unnamed protein product [Withania somnifera]